MMRAADFLKSKGYKTIIPLPSHVRFHDKPSVLKDKKYDETTIKKWEGEGAFLHLSNIKKSDIVYIYNKGSYLGPAVTVEIGYALALGKPIYARAEVKDITVTNFIDNIYSPEQLVKYLEKIS